MRRQTACARILRRRGFHEATLQLLRCGDEGCFWPEFKTNEAIERAGYAPGCDIAIPPDIAASDRFDEQTGAYHFALELRKFTSIEFAALLVDWCDRYPLISIEDAGRVSTWKSMMSGKEFDDLSDER